MESDREEDKLLLGEKNSIKESHVKVAETPRRNKKRDSALLNSNLVQIHINEYNDHR
jgi:hypothetical protein